MSAAAQSPRAPVSVAPPAARPPVFWSGVLIVLAGTIAYGNSLAGVFLFDDRASILQNPTIQHGWLAALSPPTQGEPVSGRPLTNLSFAVNYEISGFHAASYHVLNLAIHLLAALALFGLVRRTLLLPRLRPRWAADSLPIALAAALWWALHPLQTDSVTFVSQRAESLVGLCYLLTFYCFVRSVDSLRAPIWQAGAVAACLSGVFCKEVIVTAPLLVWLFDRTFVTGSFAAACRRHTRFYLALAATWIPLVWLVWKTGSRGGTAGFTAGVAWYDYALTQSSVITHYLALCVWPHPLLVDYGPHLAHGLAEIAPALLFVGALVAATVWLLWRRPGLGFFGAWFFVILAPSSSFVPVATETAAEHRVYLSLAALAVLAALALRTCARGPAFFAVSGALALALGTLTCRRNQDYFVELENYRSLVANEPANSRAHLNLGVQLAEAHRFAESEQEFKTSLRLHPQAADTEYNLGLTLVNLDRPGDALVHYQNAVRLNPDYGLAHAGLASLLLQAGSLSAAQPEFEAAARLLPDAPEAHLGLANIYIQNHQWDLATAQYRRALELAPDNAAACFNLGNLLVQANKIADAEKQFAAVVRLNPAFADGHGNLAYCLTLLNRYDEAIREYEAALRLNPAAPNLRSGLDQARTLQAATKPVH